MLDGKIAGDKLNCYIERRKPFFDFSFRFEVGYVVDCPLREFGGKADRLVAIARLRASSGEPVILGDVYSVPALPEALHGKVDMQKFKGELEFSGAIGIGEGEYEVDLLIADSHNRFYRKSWKTKAELHGPERRAEVSLRPNEIQPLVLINTDRLESNSESPLHLTVLLNGAPIYPFSRKLRAWDRAFLLGSLGSLMRQVPTAKIRLVAFNVDQQKQLFESDNLTSDGIEQLAGDLRQLELGTISYQTLGRQTGWEDLLAQMMSTASSPKAKTDAVIFLGPMIRQGDRIPKEILNCPAQNGPHLFYLQYLAFFGSQYPDSIDYLTKSCRGRVLAFHSPGELEQAIEKLRASLGRGSPADR